MGTMHNLKVATYEIVLNLNSSEHDFPDKPGRIANL